MSESKPSALRIVTEADAVEVEFEYLVKTLYAAVTADYHVVFVDEYGAKLKHLRENQDALYQLAFHKLAHGTRIIGIGF